MWVRYRQNDADPDPNFRVDLMPIHTLFGLAPNTADPHADPTKSFTHVGKKQEFFLLLITALPLYNVLSFSSVSNVSYVFSILDSILKFSGNKSTLSTFFICLDGYRSGSASSGSACPGCRSRSEAGKIMRIRPDPGPDPQPLSSTLNLYFKPFF
jgi:hypothetical protein